MTGSGTIDDPYIIMDVDDLQDMEDHLTAYYELGADIDASDTITWNLGVGFNPVGSAALGQWFEGHLDGNGRTITDLFINRPSEDAIGLFGQIKLGVTIKDVHIRACNITGGSFVGALVGYIQTPSLGVITIDTCSSTGTVTGYDYVGGLIGSDDQVGGGPSGPSYPPEPI